MGGQPQNDDSQITRVIGIFPRRIKPAEKSYANRRSRHPSHELITIKSGS